MNRYDEKIVALGLQIPESILPVGNFVPYVVANNLVYVSGQIPLQGGRPAFVGKLGRDFTVEEGQKAARICALQVLGIIKDACGGDLSKVVRCVRLGGFINSLPEFTNQPQVMNGASDLMVSVFGDSGRHARAAVGVNSLPAGVAVEVDAIFEIATAITDAIRRNEFTE